MDLTKIFEAMVAQGIFKKEDLETDMMSAIAAAGNDIRWARERRKELEIRIKEACKPREGDIKLGGDD